MAGKPERWRLELVKKESKSQSTKQKSGTGRMAAPKYILEIYTAKDGQRWRMTRKGKIVCESGEAYPTAQHLFRAIDSLQKGLFQDNIIKLTT